MSYSTFEYSGLDISVDEEYIIVDFDITNTSDMDGKKCARVYYRDPISSVFRPFKELCGFEKKLIKAGECEHYTMKVPKEYFAFCSTAFDKWIVESGDYEIMVGASSQDVRLRKNIRI